MHKKLLTPVVLIPLVLSGWTAAFAQEEEDKPPYVTPVDTFTCSYNDDKGPGDLEKAITNWNAWMDDEGVDSYGAVTMTPYYFGDDTFNAVFKYVVGAHS